MPVKSIYNKYFQKSKVFLYPLLGIKRGVKVIPSETYLAWNDSIKTEDMKLICLYHPDVDDYSNYEAKMLINHSRLHDVIPIDENNKVYVFDFSDLKDDWNYFIDGKYSKMDDATKEKILSFFEAKSANYVYIKSYLYPEKYFEDYAECLGVDIDVLKTVGELCNKPDIEKETLLLNKESKLKNTEIIN